MVTGAGNRNKASRLWQQVRDLQRDRDIDVILLPIDAGDRVHVELIGTDGEQGFIDFARAG